VYKLSRRSLAIIKMIIIYLALILCFLGCQTDMKSFEKGNSDSSRKVLIAAEDSSFKRKVVTRIIDKLGTQDCYFRIIGLGHLKEEDTGQYGAILLVCKLTGGRVEARAKAFLQKNPSNPKAIVLLTSSFGGPIPKLAKADMSSVDAVTSASKNSQVEMRTDQLIELLIKRF